MKPQKIEKYKQYVQLVEQFNRKGRLTNDYLQNEAVDLISHDRLFAICGQDNVMLKYPGGRAANLFTTIYARTDRRGTLYGDKGYIEVLNINNPEKISVFDTETGDALLLKEYDVPKQISGYEYEVLACKRAIENGQTECEEMPHSEILKMMHLMDDIRKSFGIVYPEEK